MSDYPMLISNKLHSFRNFMAQNSQFVLTKFSICAYKILNVYGCERCKVLVVSGLLVIVLDYSSTFILVVKEQ